MTPNMKVTFDRLLIREIDLDNEFQGIIVSALNKIDEPISGTVEKIGPEVSIDITEGDIIYCSPRSGFKVDIGGVKYRIIKQDDIALIE
jgi:co-chaperonin GroES (HSP10)